MVSREQQPWIQKSTDLFDEYGLNIEHSGGVTDAYEYTAPVINVDLAMGFLLDLVKSKGAVLGSSRPRIRTSQDIQPRRHGQEKESEVIR